MKSSRDKKNAMMEEQDAKIAMIMSVVDVTPEQAAQLLNANGGNVDGAMAQFNAAGKKELPQVEKTDFKIASNCDTAYTKVPKSARRRNKEDVDDDSIAKPTFARHEYGKKTMSESLDAFQ